MYVNFKLNRIIETITKTRFESVPYACCLRVLWNLLLTPLLLRQAVVRIFVTSLEPLKRQQQKQQNRSTRTRTSAISRRHVLKGNDSRRVTKSRTLRSPLHCRLLLPTPGRVFCSGAQMISIPTVTGTESEQRAFCTA